MLCTGEPEKLGDLCRWDRRCPKQFGWVRRKCTFKLTYAAGLSCKTAVASKLHTNDIQRHNFNEFVVIVLRFMPENDF